MRHFAAFLLVLMLSRAAAAHISSSGFLVLRIEGGEVSGSLELALRDAELAVGIDANHDGKITWGELRESQFELSRYVAQHLVLSAQDSACPLTFQPIEVNERVDGNYAWLPFTAHCTAKPGELSVAYSLMKGLDPSHRGLLTLISGTATQVGVLGGSAAVASFRLE